jgi:hypothetical protein
MVDMKKEKEPIGGGERISVPEEFPTFESPRKVETQPEVESWIQKIEKRLSRIPKGQPGLQDDIVVIPQDQSQQPPVTLPVTQQQITANHQAKPELSIAWLVTWAIRRIKMMARVGRRVRLQDIPEREETTV